jgi:hypothetical protein
MNRWITNNLRGSAFYWLFIALICKLLVIGYLNHKKNLKKDIITINKN